ncbi:MAG: MATE family efflux transporter [Gammaproteobacteria bacterium]|nr:MATE family efflux transporter [Gammaproteobacteria bacterium]
MSESHAKFVEGSLLKHIVVMSMTSSVGIMAIFAADLVDLIFISMLGNVALAAAVGYAGTALFFTNSISIALSIAGGVLVAKSLGADDEEDARSKANAVSGIGIGLSILVAGGVYAFAEQIIASLGATGETLAQAVSYLRIVVLSMPIMAIAMHANALLRAHGDAKRAMYSTLAGAFVNAALDPIFIFVLGLDIKGAAMATVAARVTILITSVWPVIRYYNGMSLPSPSQIHTHFKTVLAIMLPAILTNVATPIGMAIVTRSMAKYGTDAVAGMAIIGRLTPVAFAVVFALSGAIGPIVGQNVGAKRYDRVKTAVLDAVKFVTIYVIVMTVVLYLLRPYIAAVFEADGIALELLYLFCGPLALAYIFNGMIFVGNASFNNLGKPSYASWINWGRNTVGTYPFVLIGAYFWGAEGVLIGQAVGGIMFAFLGLWLVTELIDSNVDPEHEPFGHALRDHINAWRGRCH